MYLVTYSLSRTFTDRIMSWYALMTQITDYIFHCEVLRIRSLHVCHGIRGEAQTRQ